MTFEENLWRHLFVSKRFLLHPVWPPLSLPTCCRAAAEPSSPLSQQREWRRCSFPWLRVLLLCAAPQAAAPWGRPCAGSLHLREPWHCIPEVQRRAVLPCCLGNANCRDTEYSSWTRGLIQGWEIMKRSALCYICLFLLQYVLNGWVVPKDTSCLWNNF